MSDKLQLQIEELLNDTANNNSHLKHDHPRPITGWMLGSQWFDTVVIRFMTKRTIVFTISVPNDRLPYMRQILLALDIHQLKERT